MKYLIACCIQFFSFQLSSQTIVDHVKLQYQYANLPFLTVEGHGLELLVGKELNTIWSFDLGLDFFPKKSEIFNTYTNTVVKGSSETAYLGLGVSAQFKPLKDTGWNLGLALGYSFNRIRIPIDIYETDLLAEQIEYLNKNNRFLTIKTKFELAHTISESVEFISGFNIRIPVKQQSISTNYTISEIRENENKVVVSISLGAKYKFVR